MTHKHHLLLIAAAFIGLVSNSDAQTPVSAEITSHKNGDKVEGPLLNLTWEGGGEHGYHLSVGTMSTFRAGSDFKTYDPQGDIYNGKITTESISLYLSLKMSLYGFNYKALATLINCLDRQGTALHEYS